MIEQTTVGQEQDSKPADGKSELNGGLAARVPFCSEDLNDLMSEFMAIIIDLGMTEVEDVIDTAIARCSVKKGRIPAARKLIETAFEILHEYKAANVKLTGSPASGESELNAGLELEKQ